MYTSILINTRLYNENILLDFTFFKSKNLRYYRKIYDIIKVRRQVIILYEF